jgi:U4/U6.U5 tri-snRNP-associated protein 2
VLTWLLVGPCPVSRSLRSRLTVIRSDADVDAPASSAPHSSLYDLIANIPFESSIASTTTKTGSKTATNPAKKQKIDEGDMAKWKVHLRAGGGGGDAEKWFSVENLRVEEVQREMVFLGETVIQIWQRRDLGPA